MPSVDIKNQEFSYGKGLTYFLSIVCILFLFVSVNLAVSAVTDVSKPDNLSFIFLLISFGLIGMAIYAMLDIIKGKFIITPEQLIHHTPFKKKVLNRNDIYGFRIDPHYIYFIPKDRKKNGIKISRYYKNADLLINEVSSFFDNVGQVRYENDIKEILVNDEFGKNALDRSKKLKAAYAAAPATF